MKLPDRYATRLFLAGLIFCQSTLARDTLQRTPEQYEFKVMLAPAGFTSIEKGITGFQQAISDVATELDVSFTKEESKHKNRVVTYLDTKACHLKRNNFILRKRFKFKDDIPVELKLTLKFRDNAIGVVSQTPFVAQPSSALTRSKFEADVVRNPSSSSLPQTKYSRSSSIELGELDSISQLLTLYPVLQVLETDGEPRLDDPDMKLERVNQFAAFETKIPIGTLQFGDAACNASFSFWYATPGKFTPVAAEFSYDCETESNAARRFHQALLGLQDWVSPIATTKTSIAYGDACGSV